MADFAPKKEAGMAKGSLAKDNSSEHQSPPSIYLEHHHLEKLLPKGSKMPPVGSKIKISGLAHVGATSEHAQNPPSGGKAQKGGEGNTKRSMTLHLHKMEMGKDGADGVSDVEQEEQSRKGAKAEMEKALSRREGTSEGKGSKGENDLEVSPH
jgi:hypothetical protein